MEYLPEVSELRRAVRCLSVCSCLSLLSAVKTAVVHNARGLENIGLGSGVSVILTARVYS